MKRFSQTVKAFALTGMVGISFIYIPTLTSEVSPSSTSALKAAERPTTMSINGMVATPHYLASQAALNILRNGGNAIDAATAAAATLAVVYPQMNTIGGDNFWLIYNAKTQELRGLNASGRSGEKASIAFYKSKGYNKIPPRGYLSANTVPGAISGWWQAYNYAQRAMQNNMPWPKLLESAIGYADNGFPVSTSQSRWTKINIDTKDKEIHDLQRFNGFRATYLKSNGEPYTVGEVFKQKELAQTLKVVALKGADGFYRGEIAQKIVSDLQAHGGILTLSDFAKNTADWVQPISVAYRGYRAYNLPPNTQGMASLEILNVLNNFDLKKMGEGTADYYQVIVEATKQAFADRDKWLTDPEFIKVPLNYLLSAPHGKDLATLIDMRKATTEVKPLAAKGDTVWIGVVDKDGNAVSLIQSIYYDYGSGIIPPGTGVLLQNRGSFFSLDPSRVNHLEPRKRTFHTLNPAMLFKDGKPYLVYGTMGGEGQPQTQTALVTRIVDFGFSVQDAIDAPRWLLGRTWGASSNDLKIEGRVPKTVIQDLLNRGQPVKVVEDYTDTMGHAGAIQIAPVTNVKFGGEDPRGDGTAVGY